MGQLDEIIRNPLAMHGRAFPLEMLEIIQAQSTTPCPARVPFSPLPPLLPSVAVVLFQRPRRCYPHHCCPMLLQAELEVRWQQLSATIPLGLPQASPSAPSVAQLELYSSFIATEQAAATTAAAAAAEEARHQHQHQRQWRQCDILAAATQHSQQQHQLARCLCLSLRQVPTTPRTPPATQTRRDEVQRSPARWPLRKASPLSTASS